MKFIRTDTIKLFTSNYLWCDKKKYVGMYCISLDIVLSVLCVCEMFYQACLYV